MAPGAPHLHGEDDHCEADGRGDAYGHDDCLGVVEAGNHAHHVGQADSQDRLRRDGVLAPRAMAPPTLLHALCCSKA